MQRNKLLIWSILVLTVVLSLLALLLPTPGSWPPDSVEFHQQLIVNIIMATTHTGGALLLLINLDVYKAKLRRAYIVIAIGTLATGLGTLQISLITLLNGWESLYARSGLTMLPFLLSGILLYLGVRSFTKLVGAKHPLTKLYLVLPGVLVLVLLSSLLPHVQDRNILESTYDVLVGISVWSGLLILSAAWLALNIRRHAGAHYTHAMKWLTRALIVSSLVLLYQGVYTLINLGFNPVLNLISNTVTLLSGVMWLRAGYAFALIKYYSDDIAFYKFLLSRTHHDVSGPQTAVDMVTYAAALASNSSDIDPLLDRVRAVTAKLKPGEQPTAKDTQVLAEVYIDIERYLVTKEVIRTFTEKELRSRLTPELRQLVAQTKSTQ